MKRIHRERRRVSTSRETGIKVNKHVRHQKKVMTQKGIEGMWRNCKLKRSNGLYDFKMMQERNKTITPHAKTRSARHLREHSCGLFSC